MLSWWRQRKERQQQVIRDADNLVVPVWRARLFGV
jgi:hypothetical protein